MLTESDAPVQVAVKGLNKSFGPFQALRDINLSIQRGEFFSLLGSSGCGKTTLLRALAGFVTCDSGEIFIGGQEVSALPPYRPPVNMMFQSYALFPHMNVFDNIAFGLRRARLPMAEIRRRTGDALDLIAMPSFAARMPQQLSGGQRQRVGLARALVNRPDVLLLDEPLSALDKKLRESTRQELIGIQERTGVTFVMVTHDQDEALTMSSRIAVMSEGRIVQTGTPTDIYEHPQTRFVADFVGSINLFDGVVSAVEAGVATVRLPTLRTDVQAFNRGFPVGAAVTLAIRPEKIKLEPSGGVIAAETILSGEIAAQSYIGDKRIYQVRLSDDVTLQVSQSTDDRHSGPLPRHAAVRVGWDMTAATLVGA